jgi:hypothetical protein
MLLRVLQGLLQHLFVLLRVLHYQTHALQKTIAHVSLYKIANKRRSFKPFLSIKQFKKVFERPERVYSVLCTCFCIIILCHLPYNIKQRHVLIINKKNPMTKIKNGFDRMSEAKLLFEAITIGTQCTGNAYFVSIQAMVALLVTATTAFQNALDAAQSGDKNAIADKDVKKAELVSILRKLGDTISGIAGGNYQVLVSSGFPLVKEREPSQPLTKPNPPVVKAGFNAGEIMTIGEREKSAKAVIHMITADPAQENSWKRNFTTGRRYTFTNLESGKRYWFKQAVIGVNKQYIESDAVSYIAQ